MKKKKSIKGFNVCRRGDWWVVSPIQELSSIVDFENMTGASVEYNAYPPHRRDAAIDKMFALIDEIEKENE